MQVSSNFTLCLLPQHYFTVNFNHENQKTLELRTEDAKDCDEWVAAIAHARYRPPPAQTRGQGVLEAKLCLRAAAGRAAGREALSQALPAGRAECFWSPAPCWGPSCRAGGCIQTAPPAPRLPVPIPIPIPVPAAPAGWRCLSRPGAGGMSDSPSGSKAVRKGFIWNSKNGQKEVFPSSCFPAMGMLAQPTCSLWESGQEPAQRSCMSSKGGCRAGSEKRGQMSVVCGRLEKYHLLQHLNESRCS